MDQRVSVITLGVGDLERSRRFYEDGLGWHGKHDNPGIVFFQLPGAVLSLFPRAELAKDAQVPEAGSGFRGVTVAYCGRDKAEVDAVLRQAAAAGGKIVKPAEEAFWGGYSGYFSDPDGHLWEVAWNPHWTFDESGGIRLSP